MRGGHWPESKTSLYGCKSVRRPRTPVTLPVQPEPIAALKNGVVKAVVGPPLAGDAAAVALMAPMRAV